MSTIYLHIGTPKTGTTALQHLLAENRKLLENYHIAYPDYGFRYSDVSNLRNGHFLVRTLPKSENSGDASRLSGDYKKGLDFLEKTAGQFDKIILSDEGIWNGSRMLPDFWTNLKADLDKRQLSLRIIVYLRRQDLIVQSLFEHSIRRSSTSCSFTEFLENILTRSNPFYLDYYAYLSALAEVFGWESLIVRVYEKEQFCGPEGDLFSDFLQIFGLKMTDGFHMQKTTYNEHMSKSHTEIRRILNCIPLQAGEEPLRSIRLTHGIHLPDDAEETPYSWFEPNAQRQFLKQYEEGNSQIARICLKRADGTLFQESLAELPPFHVEDHELLTHMILSYGQAINTLMHTVEEQNKEIAKLQNDILARSEGAVWTRLKRKAARILKKED